MSKMMLVVAMAVIIARSSVWGAPATTQAATTQSVRSLEQVETRFEGRLARLQREHESQIKAARELRNAELRSLLDQAMEKKDVDEAVRVRDALKRAESEATRTPAVQTKKVTSTFFEVYFIHAKNCTRR